MNQIVSFMVKKFTKINKGYPNHKELKAKLYEIQESHTSWAPHEKGLNDNLKRL